jgi:UPF0755 protein
MIVRISVLVFLVLSAYAILAGPPAHYPAGALLTIPEGTTIAQAGLVLKDEGALQSPFLFSILIRLGRDSIVAGTYLLPARENIFSLAYRFSHGKTGVAPVRVTIPEGTAVVQAAAILRAALPGFDTAKFMTLAKPDEGYLFPDTYFFFPGASPESVIQAMQTDFQKRTAPLQGEMQSFGKPESDIIIMASILEKEARQSQTRRTIAGILWKRLSLGMPLQVDATFGYIFGTATYSPSASDLMVDSPYNTYKYKGLPPGPIGNPGVETIEDAMTPIATPYLYYVTDKDGNIYYAATFAEQLANIQKAK